MVLHGGSHKASYINSNLIWHLQKFEAGYEEFCAASELNAVLKQQTLLTLLTSTDLLLMIAKLSDLVEPQTLCSVTGHFSETNK